MPEKNKTTMSQGAVTINLRDEGADSLGDRIAPLAARWRKETGHLSSTDRKVLHDAYQQIMAMGPKAIPYVLRELRDRGGHWFWALHFMSGVDLGSDGQTVEELRQAWLEWGRKEGYL